LCQSLTYEELLGWFAFAQLEQEEFKKDQQQAQRNSALKGRKR
tara:strand:+ start:251 stop:379 length:129 start_codon:yes stop_codon:yes gene_type:complete